MSRKLKYFLAGLFVSGWLFFVGPSYAWATEPGGQEQVIISPAQQAVNTALATANTEVQQAISATDTATATIATAQTEIAQTQAEVSEILSTITTAQNNIALIDTATVTISSIDLTTNPVNQSSQIVQDAKATIATATASVTAVQTEITQAQTEISQATSARAAAVTAQTSAQTELTQANIAIDNAQTAVNNLQATIGTSTNVLAGVDDAGIKMNLPFNLLMGGTVYNNVYVGSNATITFGVNEGWVYYQTPNAPSVSIAGWDWTTWSTGTGITYATTGTSLDIAWDVRPYPQMDASTQMVQIRFNADVNPTDGAWIANVSATGPIPNGARFNYRETTNGTITPIADTNTGSGFAGQISQGSAFTPYVDPNTSTVQAAVDAANATITQLNQSLTPVVTQNATNNSTLSSMQSTITSLNNTINTANTTKNNLQTQLNTNAQELNTAITTYIPTPPPVIDSIVFADGKATISVSMPEGYNSNTWFYRITTTDPNAENPYASQTLNTEGSPSSFEITGLTEGATYTISVANWSGPVSNFTDYNLSIPATQSANLTIGGNYDYIDAQTPPTDTTQDPGTDTGTDTTPDIPNNPDDGGSSGDDGSQNTDTTESDTSSSSDGQDNNPSQNPDTTPSNNDTLTVEEIQGAVSNLIADGNITASDASAVLDILAADGSITATEVANLSDVLAADGVLNLAEKDLLADALIQSADGQAISVADIKAAGLEYRDLPPATPVETRTDMNGNPVVITAEVASALLTLESPAALISGVAACINPDEAIEGLTEEQKCEIFKALSNIGADMSPQERQKAKEVLVAAVLVGQVILGSSILRIRG